jgi:hypothetical protein
MDQTKYINTYVDHAVGMIHEQLGTILQLKTQLKLIQEGHFEKDQMISNLRQEIENTKKESESNKVDNTQIVTLRENARSWEESYISMSAKVAHMNTLLNQVSEMKSQIIERDARIVELLSKIETIKNPPQPVINKKKRAVEPTVDTKSSIVEEQQKAKDDF